MIGRNAGSNPAPSTNTDTMPTELGPFDRTRIDRDLEQYRELIERKQFVWEQETDPDRKAELAAELASLSDLLTQTIAYLQ